MIFSEPQRTPYDLHFVLLGVPVRVHPMFWLVSLLFGLNGARHDPTLVLVWVLAVFVSILVHEMGHALTVRWCGYQPWVTLYGMGGLASYQPGPRNPRNRILILLAGPGAGFLLAAVIVLLIRVMGHEIAFAPEDLPGVPLEFELFANSKLNEFIYDMLMINIFWGMVNLLPVLPLDGGQVAREVLDLQSPGDGLRRSLMVSMWVGGAVAVYALAKLREPYIALMFGYLAYTSFAALESYFGRGRGFGGRW